MGIGMNVGVVIGRPPVTVSANQEIANGAEDKSSPQVQRIMLSQIAFCGRAMRAPTFFISRCRYWGEKRL